MWKLIAMFCIYVAPDLCGMIPDPEFEAADSTLLRINDQNFVNLRPRIQTRQHYCANQEAVFWYDRAWGGGTREAHIVLTIHEPDCLLNGSARTADEEMDRFTWLAEGKHVLDGDVFAIMAPLGEFHVQKFERDERFCFFFYNGLKDLPPPVRDGIRRRVVGYACGYPRISNTHDEIRRFLAGISVSDTSGTGIVELDGASQVRSENRARSTAEDPPTKSWILISWEGIGNQKRALVTYSSVSAGGGLSFHDAESAIDCDGVWFKSGDWTAHCTNGRTLSGRSFRFQHGAILGTGTDDLGRGFRFGESGRVR